MERWLPLHFVLNPKMVSVRWLDCGTKDFSEPFYTQTVWALRTTTPPAEERTTGLTEFLELAESLPPIKPSGLIFHISRCGSTALVNALRLAQEVTVLAEARPFAEMLLPDVFRKSPFPAEGWEEARKTFLNGLVAMYAQGRNGIQRKLVLKCHPVSTLHIAIARAVWPDVPAVVVIRDPVEVIVSNLAKPAHWVRWKSDRPDVARDAFGWTERNLAGMSLEEYCARGIGSFCESAMMHVDSGCRVIDYQSLNVERLRSVAEFFDIDAASEPAAIERTLSGYSKDPEGARPFRDDEERKQREATEAVRSAAQRWARQPYERLRALERW